MEKYANKLRQYLGTWGCQTKMLDYDHLVETAKLAFDVQGKNVVDVAVAVEKLGTRERSARVREAMRKHWPTPNVLWPAHANARKELAKDA